MDRFERSRAISNAFKPTRELCRAIDNSLEKIEKVRFTIGLAPLRTPYEAEKTLVSLHQEVEDLMCKIDGDRMDLENAVIESDELLATANKALADFDKDFEMLRAALEERKKKSAEDIPCSKVDGHDLKKKSTQDIPCSKEDGHDLKKKSTQDIPSSKVRGHDLKKKSTQDTPSSKVGGHFLKKKSTQDTPSSKVGGHFLKKKSTQDIPSSKLGGHDLKKKGTQDIPSSKVGGHDLKKKNTQDIPCADSEKKLVTPEDVEKPRPIMGAETREFVRVERYFKDVYADGVRVTPNLFQRCKSMTSFKKPTKRMN